MTRVLALYLRAQAPGLVRGLLLFALAAGTAVVVVVGVLSGIAGMLVEEWEATVGLAVIGVWWRTGRTPFYWLARAALILDAAIEAAIEAAPLACALWARRWRRRLRP